jgi:hypothetical protein
LLWGNYKRAAAIVIVWRDGEKKPALTANAWVETSLMTDRGSGERVNAGTCMSLHREAINKKQQPGAKIIRIQLLEVKPSEKLSGIQKPEGEATPGPGWKGLNTGTDELGIGDPISPGAIFPLPELGIPSSTSCLTNVLPCASFCMAKNPPPFWTSPSVSQISNSSFIWTGASLAGRIWSTCRRTALISWNVSPFFLLADNCLHAWQTIRRTFTGREVPGRPAPPITPNEFVFDQPASGVDIRFPAPYVNGACILGTFDQVEAPGKGDPNAIGGVPQVFPTPANPSILFSRGAIVSRG